MYTYAYTFICLHIFIYICVYICIYIYMCICICIYIHIYIYKYTHKYIYTYIYIYTCIYTYTYIYIWCGCIQIQTHTPIQRAAGRAHKGEHGIQLVLRGKSAKEWGACRTLWRWCDKTPRTARPSLFKGKKCRKKMSKQTRVFMGFFSLKVLRLKFSYCLTVNIIGTKNSVCADKSVRTYKLNSEQSARSWVSVVNTQGTDFSEFLIKILVQLGRHS